MKNIIIVSLLFLGNTFAQNFLVESVKGVVKAQIGSSEKWVDVKIGAELSPYSTVYTGKNSSVVIIKENTKLTLKELSAVTISHIKLMSVDELLLALAMEDMFSAPRKKNDNKSKSTQVYGDNSKVETNLLVKNNEFGHMRLNGAKHLAESGFKESAIIAARETYRKYPETNKLISFRIYFANLLYEKGLFEEAFADFNSFKDFEMDEQEKLEVDSKLKLLTTKLIRK